MNRGQYRVIRADGTETVHEGKTGHWGCRQSSRGTLAFWRFVRKRTIMTVPLV